MRESFEICVKFWAFFVNFSFVCFEFGVNFWYLLLNFSFSCGFFEFGLVRLYAEYWKRITDNRLLFLGSFALIKVRNQFSVFCILHILHLNFKFTENSHFFTKAWILTFVLAFFVKNSGFAWFFLNLAWIFGLFAKIC